MSESKNELKEQAVGVLGKAYDDFAHPSAKSVGNTLSLLPRTIGVWLGKWEKWIINGEETIRLTAQAVQKKAEKIPEEKLTEPEPYVAIPAIQQLSYCYNSIELREMYANLLVSSMNIDTKHNVHPAFVDIIKQLTPDEARLLNYLSHSGLQYPLIDIRVFKGKEYYLAVQNYTVISKSICNNISGIFPYLHNLRRLELIEINENAALSDESLYAPLEESPEIEVLENELLHDGKLYKIFRKHFEITPFGRDFIKICIETEG